MIELDTQTMPTARAMSFLFWACSAFKVRKEFYVTLKLVWEKGAIEICKYRDQDKALANDLVDLGWLVYSDSLFTSDESAYLNYMFNNAEFSNSLALRNKYDHGTFRA